MSSYFDIRHTFQVISYDLFLFPNITEDTYRGFVTIQLELEEESDFLYINHIDFNIEIILVNDEECHFHSEPTCERIKVIPPLPLPVGLSVININFDGEISKHHGLCKLSYTKPSGENRCLVTPHFRVTSARELFPCFDDPDKKAIFKLHVLAPDHSGYHVLFNMQVKEIEELEEGRLFHFEETIKSSANHFRFIISDFEFIQETVAKIPFRIYAKSSALEHTIFARNAGKALMEFYLKYFDIDIPLSKLDLVIIPDYEVRNLCHWGLITFKEECFLANSDTSPLVKQEIVITIAHELARLWFDVLVTMGWWDDFWLNQSYATFLAYKGIDSLFPDWEIFNEHVVSIVHPVLLYDSSLVNHRLIMDVLSPEQIRDTFDVITLRKGVPILRMLEAILTSTEFRKLSNSYVATNLFGNATSLQFFDEVKNFLPEYLQNFMASWCFQIGYPILEVDIIDNTAVLTQKPCLQSTDVSVINSKWTIPVTYITDDIEQHEFIYIVDEDESVSIDIPPKHKWVKFNSGQIGYYRVNYKPNVWKNFNNFIADMTIPDKANLLDDAFSLAATGACSYDVPFTLSTYLKREKNVFPWIVFARHFKILKSFLKTTDHFDVLRNFVTQLIEPHYQDSLWSIQSGSPHLAYRFSFVVLKLATDTQFEPWTEIANDLFHRWMNGDKIPKYLSEIIYIVGVRKADSDTWEKILEKYKLERDLHEKAILIRALASTQDFNNLNVLIDLVDANAIPLGDQFECLVAISKQPGGELLIWQYVKKSWMDLRKKFTNTDRNATTLLNIVMSRFKSEELLDEVEEFYNGIPEKVGRFKGRAAENIKRHDEWLTTNLESVVRWLEEYASSEGTTL